MDITPLKNTVYLEFSQPSAGALDTSSRQSAVEYATVIAIGENVSQLKVGDSVFCKSFGIDTITHNDKTYRFCNVQTGAILAVVKP